jgi:hypothetical protein
LPLDKEWAWGSFAVSSTCESVTPPTVAAQIKSLGGLLAAAVTEAIARIEEHGDLKFRTPDPLEANDYLNTSVPGVLLRYTVVDGGAAFIVRSVRRYFVD